jgi:hypothetical protein
VYDHPVLTDAHTRPVVDAPLDRVAAAVALGTALSSPTAMARQAVMVETRRRIIE